MNNPIIETKAKEHYDFLKKSFDTYILYKDFMNRMDLFVVVIRDDNNKIIGLSLVRNTSMEDSKWVNVLNGNGEKILYKGRPKLNKKGKLILDDDGNPKMEYNVVTIFSIYRIVLTLVEEQSRGQGINQHLLSFIYDNAKKIGDVKYLLANIRESNKASINSFIKNGYKVSKKFTTPYKNGEKKIRVIRFIKT